MTTADRNLIEAAKGTRSDHNYIASLIKYADTEEAREELGRMERAALLYETIADDFRHDEYSGREDFCYDDYD